MSFERFRVQTFIESELGCTEIKKWPSYKAKFEALIISNQQNATLNHMLIEDAQDLFYKGLLSLTEALLEVHQGKHSWATVKLYYSMFYFLKSSLAAKGYALLRNGSLYLLHIKPGMAPEKKASNRGGRYCNDHVGVISIYEDIVGENDILRTNNIDDQNVYEWLMTKRNIIHYNQRSFLEPEYADFFHYARDAVANSKFSELIDVYINDKLPIYCFDPDHACIAAPVRRALLTKKDLIHTGISTFAEDKLSIYKDMLKDVLTPTSSLWNLYSGDA